LVSDISLWEIATLASLGRIEVSIPIREWLENACAEPLVHRCGISPAIAAEVAALPDSFHRDPADRILVATARVLGATLLTQDRRIVEAGLATTLS
jgi:PIN domain nuclease of toxin-antitoxin system